MDYSHSGGMLMKLLKVFLSTEFFFVMFLFSGAFKESIDFPIDIAVVFLALSVLGTGYCLVKEPKIKKWKFYPIFIFFGLFAIMLLSFIFTQYTSDSIEKIIKYGFLTLPTIFLPLLFIDGKESLNKILLSIAVLSTLLSTISIPMILNPEGMFIGFNDGNYMGLARLTGIGFIVLSYFMIISQRKYKPIIFIAFILTAVTLLSTGSRMPLVAVGVASIYLLSKVFTRINGQLHIRKKAIYIMSLIVLLATFVYYLFSKGMFGTIVYRFNALMQAGGGGSVSARLERYRASLNMFNEHPILGVGTGNFGLYHDTDGVGSYSHNMFFELISEMGTLGGLWFFLFVSVILYSIFKMMKSYSIPMRTTMVISFLYLFMNAMVSGDINDNRALFFFAVIIIYMAFDRECESNEMRNQNLNFKTSQ